MDLDEKMDPNSGYMEQDGLILRVDDVDRDHGTMTQSEVRNNEKPLLRRITLKCSPWKMIRSTFLKLILVVIVYLCLHYFVNIEDINDTSLGENTHNDDDGYYGFLQKRMSLLSISLIILFFYVMYCMLTSVVEESMTILRGKGIQLEKKVFYGSKTRRLFIPMNDVKFVAINEGFHIDCVIYYFTIVLTRPYDGKLLILPFDTWYPRLKLLKVIYLKSKEFINSRGLQ